MLTPKKTGDFDKKSWEDLDRMLQNFVDYEKFSKPSATIRHSDYEMPKSEIIEVAESSGYTVEDKGVFLVFT